MSIGKRGGCGAVTGTLVLIGLATFLVAAPPAATQSSAPPQYDPDGNLLRPDGFETWVFVGSNLGLAYKGESDTDTREFHNVYISPPAYAEFVKSQTFPDRTVFVVDRLTAKDNEPKGVVSAGVFNDQRLGLLVAVKNLNRPDKGTLPWAYYLFPAKDNPPPAKAQPDSSSVKTDSEKEKTCEGCHAKHASRDHVWVQFYPILRNLVH
jgi:hypothetical protein